MDKWIVISFYEYRMESGYIIEEFESEQKAIEHSNAINEDDFYCVAKIIK